VLHALWVAAPHFAFRVLDRGLAAK
jgi:hypothetical protein